MDRLLLFFLKIVLHLSHDGVTEVSSGSAEIPSAPAMRRKLKILTTTSTQWHKMKNRQV